MQVVILSQVLVDEVNTGLQHMCELEVLACDGVPVRNIAHLKKLIDSAAGDFIRFDLDDDRYGLLFSHSSERTVCCVRVLHVASTSV